MAEGTPDRSARDALVEATARRLWAADEGELRILDICQETGLSTSVIYGHFRSRQGLVDAALLTILTEVTDGIVEGIEGVLDGPHPTGRFLDSLHRYVTDPTLEREHTRNRQAYFRVAASALARPSLRPGFLEVYARYMGRCGELYDGAVGRGLLPASLTGRQWALLLESQMVARALHDLDADWDDQGDWLLALTRLASAHGASPTLTP